jgi:NitT/TauT family transport system ATP-binding protein
VRDTSLTIGAGEIRVRGGPTGCGKSTLLNVAAGLLAPSSGRALVHWRAADGNQHGGGVHVSSRRADALAQHAGQRDRGLEFHGVAKAEAVAKAREWLTRVGSAGFEDAYPHQLSGGCANAWRWRRC